MKPIYWSSFSLVLAVSLCAGENLINTYRLDSNSESYRLSLKDNWGFEVTGPDGQQVTGTYVASDRKIGLLSGNLLRHFEYQVQNGDLLLRPSTTDGPEPKGALGQMPPVKRTDQFTTYLTEAHHRQKYAAQPPAGTPAVMPPAEPPVQPVVASELLTMEQLLAQAQTDSQYHAYMAAGAKAVSERKFREARAHFILASRFKPASTEARAHIALCDGAEALAEGDDARKRGQLRDASLAYLRAKQLSPALSSIADAQLKTIHVFHPSDTRPRPWGRHSGGALERNIATQLREGRSAEALRLATGALQSDPSNLRLRTMKEGLEGLQTAEGLYGNLKDILGRAQAKCTAIQEDEPLGGQTAQWQTRFGEGVQELDKRSAAARNRFAEDAYAGLGTTLTDARSTANDSARLLEQARAAYAARATEVAENDKVDLPFVTIRRDKESDRVKRLNGYAVFFKALSNEAAALAK